MEKTFSRDGTSIAFERTGEGPPVVLVDGALCSRAFGPMPKIAPLLAERFTVITYDRRGRGDSGDTRPYAREREVEDLEALVRAAGGSASLLGLSSGGALALEAAASGVKVAKVAAYEPPFMIDDAAVHREARHQERLERLVEEGRRGDAVRYFMRRMVGIPLPFVLMMRLMPMWRKLEAVAHTLPYDAAVMGDFSLPTSRLAAVGVPTLAIHGEKSDPRLRKATRAVAEAVPGARQCTLAGQSHEVKPEILVPVVSAFFAA